MLEGRDISKRFGGVAAVTRVNISVCPGEVVGLTGPNGSGKTTLLDLLRGRVSPDSGVISVDGNPVGSQRLFQMDGAQSGVFRSYQVPRLFPKHTVAENVLLGEWGINSKIGDDPEATAIIESLPAPSQMAGTLSVGQRRRLILAWLYQRLNVVKYFLLDEPSAGGDNEYVSAMLDFVRTARAMGKGLLLVEHNRDVLAAVADRLVYMAGGSCRQSPDAAAAVLFSPAPAAPNHSSTVSGLACRDLTVMRGGAEVITKTSLEVKPTEVVGIIGPNGCGKSTLLLALYGDPTCTRIEGTVLDGAYELRPQSIPSRIARRIHLLPQEGGIFKSMTVAETIRASVESCCQTEVNTDRIQNVAWKVPHVKRIWQRRCGALSGGERRLVGLARILILNPRYALLDEPSAGLDEEAQKAVAAVIQELAAQGVGVLIAEQSNSHLLEVCTELVNLKATGSGV